jgi:hyperosmotically inducible periplasmic protein
MTAFLRASRVWLVFLFLLASTPEASGWVSDNWITVKVKIALHTKEDVSASEVSVDTVNGRVTLFGKVPTEEDKRKAEAAAHEVSGVREVRNLLEVVPPSRSRAVEATDDAVRRAVEAALANDPQLGGSAITVASVAAGVVVLGGTARNSAEHLRAVDVARSVRGVKRVKTTVATAADDADLDVWSRHELRQRGRGVLDVASDLWLTAETRMKLIADPRIPAPEISVDCRDQTITLFGIVPSPQAKRAAGADAHSVPGVRKVRNELEVVAASKKPTIVARDVELQQAVAQAIYERPEMKHAAVRVTVRNGVARLVGTAPSQQHRLFAATAARSVPGIRAVKEDIQVTTVTEPPRPATSPPPTPTAK